MSNISVYELISNGSNWLFERLNSQPLAGEAKKQVAHSAHAAVYDVATLVMGVAAVALLSGSGGLASLAWMALGFGCRQVMDRSMREGDHEFKVRNSSAVAMAGDLVGRPPTSDYFKIGGVNIIMLPPFRFAWGVQPR